MISRYGYLLTYICASIGAMSDRLPKTRVEHFFKFVKKIVQPGCLQYEKECIYKNC